MRARVTTAMDEEEAASLGMRRERVEGVRAEIL